MTARRGVPEVPCRTCPWRKTTRTEDIPGGGMCPDGMRDTVLDRNIMQCHRLDREEVCAGYLLSEEGRESALVRFARMAGLMDRRHPRACEGLWSTVAEMAAAHGEDLTSASMKRVALRFWNRAHAARNAGRGVRISADELRILGIVDGLVSERLTQAELRAMEREDG